MDPYLSLCGSSRQRHLADVKRVLMPSRVLLDRVAQAYAAADIQVLKSLYADDALICSAAAPERVLGRDETFDRVDVLQRTRLIGAVERISIDGSAGMLRAAVRTRTPDGAYKSGERIWLLTFRDDLIMRQRV